MVKNIHINSETFKNLFPFYIAINRELYIESVGASLSKLLKLPLDEDFYKYFTISHPTGACNSFDSLLLQTSSLFVLELKESNIEMKGQLIFDANDDVLLFLCEPVIRQIDELSKAGLKLSDFAKHSQVCDYMFMLQAEATARASLNHTLQALKQSNQNLVDSQQSYEDLFKATRDMIHITNHNAEIVDVNQSELKILGYSKDEMIGMSLLNIVHPDCMKKTKEMFQYVMTGKEIECYETAFINSHGEKVEIEVSVTPLVKDDDHMLCIAISRDITRRKKLEYDLAQAEEKFHQAQKMEAIGTLVGGIAHDFNNMLAGMTGNLYLAKKDMGDRPSVMTRLTNVEQLSFRAANMIQQLLTFARKGLVSMKDLPLEFFVKETLQLSKSILPETVEFACQISSDGLIVRADETQVHQILLNLLNNARDAVSTAQKPCVSLTVNLFHADDEWLNRQKNNTTREWAHITVTDNGEGIPEKNIKHLFEPFFTTKEQGKGTGLGLAMVYGAVQTHKGIIEVESSAGNGASFHVYLPLLHHAHCSAQVDNDIDYKGHGELILLADDELHVRETTAEVLHELGYKVVQAQDGLEAINLYKTNKDEIDLALLDLVMPHCSGVELAQQIRNINPNLPIIFITGYDKTHVFAGNEVMSNCEVLTKPVNFDELQKIIRNILQ